MATGAEKLRSKHIRTLEVLQKLVDENKDLKEQLTSQGWKEPTAAAAAAAPADGAEEEARRARDEARDAELGELREEAVGLRTRLQASEAHGAASDALFLQLKHARSEINRVRAQLDAATAQLAEREEEEEDDGEDSGGGSPPPCESCRQLRHDLCEARSSNLELADQLGKELAASTGARGGGDGDVNTRTVEPAELEALRLAHEDALAEQWEAMEQMRAGAVEQAARMKEAHALEGAAAQRRIEELEAELANKNTAEVAFKDELARAWSQCEELREKALEAEMDLKCVAAQQASEAAREGGGGGGASEAEWEAEREAWAVERKELSARVAAAERRSADLEEMLEFERLGGGGGGGGGDLPPAVPMAAGMQHSSSAPALPQAQQPGGSFSAHVHSQLKAENQSLRNQIDDLMRQQRRLLKGMNRPQQLGGGLPTRNGGGGGLPAKQRMMQRGGQPGQGGRRGGGSGGGNGGSQRRGGGAGDMFSMGFG